MAPFKQFHDPELSIWQAAVGEVEARRPASAQIQDVGALPVATGRPDDLDEMSSEAIAYCLQVNNGTPVIEATAVHPATEGLRANRWFLLAHSVEDRQVEDFGQFGGYAAV